MVNLFNAHAASEEKDPDMKVEDIRRILRKTSRFDIRGNEC